MVSASASSTTAAQIDDAVTHGWVDVPIPAEAFAAAPDSSWVQVVQDALTAGRDVVVHTTRGPRIPGCPAAQVPMKSVGRSGPSPAQMARPG